MPYLSQTLRKCETCRSYASVNLISQKRCVRGENSRRNKGFLPAPMITTFRESAAMSADDRCRTQSLIRAVLDDRPDGTPIANGTKTLGER